MAKAKDKAAQAGHSPLPWSIEPHTTVDKRFAIIGAGVYVDYDDVDHAEQDANAALIIRAVNSFGPLVAVLRDFCDYYAGNKGAMLGNGKAAQMLPKFRAALKAAGQP